MRLLYNALIGVAISTSSMTEAPNSRTSELVDLVVDRGKYLASMMEDFRNQIFGEEKAAWSVDLDAGTIEFTSKAKKVTAPIQVIGTYNPLDGTFLWAWDHPSIPEGLAANARVARQFGEHHKLPLYTTSKVECTQDQAREFTAVALYLTGAQGAFMGNYGTTMVHMTYGQITISPVG